MVMPVIKELLLSLAARGIHIYMEDGKLKTRSEPGAITAEVGASIRENKDGLIALLSAEAHKTPSTQQPIARAPDAGEHVLSFAQQRLWFLDHFENGSASYNMPMALRLTGVLDRRALQATLDEILSRHAILRTTYRKAQAGGGVQVIGKPAALAIAFVDLCAATDEQQAVEVARLAKAEATTPFDLAADPMLRVSLAGLSSECHVLFLTLHHIAADGWSLGVLVKEFTALYVAFSRHQANPLEPLEIQYVDFAHWQRDHCNGARQERELAFWRETLRGIAQLHGLPMDLPRPPQLGTGGGMVRYRLDADRLAALKRFANSRNATLFMVLQSAFALLMARWSGEQDIVVGTPLAGRVHPATESLIGCFINTLVLRTTVDGSMSYHQLLERSRVSTLAAYEHQHTPFEMLVEALNPERSLSHSPLFQLMFALQNYEVGSLQLPGLLIEEMANDEQNTKFDLAVIATESADGLALAWTFASGLFTESTIASMASSFDVLLQAIVSDADRNVFELPMLTDAQQADVRSRCRRAGQGLQVLDAKDNVLPPGALGQVHAIDPDDASASRAGQLGRQLADGTIDIVAQQASDLRLNGIRIDTRRIEEALAQIDAITAAFATVRSVAVEGGVATPVVVAYIEPSASPEADASRTHLVERCHEFLKARLPDFMVPKAFVIVERMPRHADLQVDVEKLPDPEQVARVRYVPPAHELEARLCAIWCELLSLDRVGTHDNFFEVGGTSMHSIMLQQDLEKAGFDVAITDLFTYPTIADLVKYLQAGAQEPLAPDPTAGFADDVHDAIAVIGMAGRFPGAPDVDAFWNNIRNGVESLRVFTDEELLAAGVDRALLDNPDYVKSGVLLDGIEEFDAGYFGFTPREAEVTDPQQRLLFECAVEALENAGYGDDSDKRAVAVHVGVGESRYLFDNLLPQSGRLGQMRLAAMYGNRQDYAATRLSYRLNLSGPSLSVGTACSTSLVAVHVACTSLLRGECDMALAGGSAIAQLDTQGYLYQEGGIASPDGHCRTFDSQAKGTRAGSGAGLVVLKRLQRALADGDTIHAVIKGSAINNDGADKVGYTAPSVFGQASVIRDAQRRAGVEPESIQYVEAHGTATELGDPIEIKALARAFGNGRRNYCGLGSVKPNVGHLDSAAGVAGLIKTVKALSERQMPPMINFNSPNPKIDFDNSPFYVNTNLRDWPRSDAGTPRRAGVSSFGIGGTNAHVVLEEAPESTAGATRRGAHLLVLSAKSQNALERAAANLQAHLQRHEDIALADVAHTLQVGRASHMFRRAFVAASRTEAIEALGGAAQQFVGSNQEASSRPSVVFMFTGQGSQYVTMGRGLYAVEPVFRQVIDHCSALLLNEIGFDLREILVPTEDSQLDPAEVERRLSRTDVAQPALFVFEIAIATLLMRWGVQPAAMIGHSLGEYVAACLAGVFSLEDGLRLVARRGHLMQATAGGRMLSVQLGEVDAAPLFATADCSLAAINSANDCVASGTEQAMRALAALLELRGVAYRELPAGHAFHSTMMDAVAKPFARLLDDIELREPMVPFVSNVTGRFILPGQATDQAYWIRHMLGTVRFADGVETLATDTALLRPARVYLEIGPGATLCSLVRKNANARKHSIVSTVRHRQEVRSDESQLLAAVGQLWMHGSRIDWPAFHDGEARRRVPLPTYPFERSRYWIEKGPSAPVAVRTGRAHSPREWFYAPTWTQLAPAVDAGATQANPADALWLVLCDEHGVGAQVCMQLQARGLDVVRVHAGERYARICEKDYTCAPAAEDDYRQLLRDLAIASARPVRALHLWSVADVSKGASEQERFDQAQPLGLYSVLYLSRSLASVCPTSSVALDLVTNRVFSVTGEEPLDAQFATTLGLCKVIPQELPQFTIRHLDLNLPLASVQPATAKRQAALLIAEATSDKRPLHVALRGSKRWALSHERCAIEAGATEPKTKRGGNYVITGGMGNIGLLLAEHLARQGATGLMLITRRAFASPEQWSELSESDLDADTRSRLDRVRQLVAGGTTVRIHAADVANPAQMREAFDVAERELGRIDGVIHGAGKVHDAVLALENITPSVCAENFQTKVAGTHVLEGILAQRDIGFCLLMSSLSSVLGGLGFGAYASANSYLDAFTQRKHNEGDRRWTCVNWDGWMFTPQGKDRVGMSPEEGVEAFDLALRLSHLPQVVNSTTALEERIEQWLHPKKASRKLESLHPRPDVPTTFVEPGTATEKRLAAIWQDVLGIGQIGIRDNFFELGGDSVMLVQVHKAIRQEVNGEVAVANLFQFPSIHELARFLDKDDGGAVAASIVNKRLERRRSRDGSARRTEVPV